MKSDPDLTVIRVHYVYEFLDAVKTKPLLWLTSKSITALQDFISGYKQLGFTHFAYEPGQPTLKDFDLWFFNWASQLNFSERSYYKVLLAYCDNDEEKAFDEFFVLLSKFLSPKAGEENEEA